MRIVSGKFRGKKLASPTTSTTRPTSDRARETIFNVLEHNSAFSPFWWEGKRVLDVFAGTGAVGLEALSRGAEFSTFIESNADALASLRANIRAMGMEAQTQVLIIDATRLPVSKVKFNIVFMDPPYGLKLIDPTFQQLLRQGWVETGSLVLVEVKKGEIIETPTRAELLFERKIGVAVIQFYRVL